MNTDEFFSDKMKSFTVGICKIILMIGFVFLILIFALNKLSDSVYHQQTFSISCSDFGVHVTSDNRTVCSCYVNGDNIDYAELCVKYVNGELI